MRRPVLRRDGAIEREIDPRLGARLRRLGAQALAGADQAAVVIGHVDNGGDAAGGGAARRPDKVFLALLAAAVHLRVDRARQHQESRPAMPFARGRATFGDVSDDAIRREHVTVLDDPIRENDCPREDLICHELPFAIAAPA